LPADDRRCRVEEAHRRPRGRCVRRPYVDLIGEILAPRHVSTHVAMLNLASEALRERPIGDETAADFNLFL
jgi:hypothetical protein